MRRVFGQMAVTAQNNSIFRHVCSYSRPGTRQAITLTIKKQASVTLVHDVFNLF